MKLTSVGLVGLIAGGTALAQDPPALTGTLKAAGASAVRASLKISAGTLILNPVSDAIGAAFSSTDLSKMVKGGEQAEVTIIGSCNVSKLGQQQTQTGDNGSVTYLDAGPFLNLKGPEGSKQIPMNKMLYSAALGGGTAGWSTPWASRSS